MNVPPVDQPAADLDPDDMFLDEMESSDSSHCRLMAPMEADDGPSQPTKPTATQTTAPPPLAPATLPDFAVIHLLVKRRSLHQYCVVVCVFVLWLTQGARTL